MGVSANSDNVHILLQNMANLVFLGTLDLLPI